MATVGVALEIVDLIAEQREKLFPDLRKIVLDYEVEFSGGWVAGWLGGWGRSEAEPPAQWRV